MKHFKRLTKRNTSKTLRFQVNSFPHIFPRKFSSISAALWVQSFCCIVASWSLIELYVCQLKRKFVLVSVGSAHFIRWFSFSKVVCYISGWKRSQYLLHSDQASVGRKKLCPPKWKRKPDEGRLEKHSEQINVAVCGTGRRMRNGRNGRSRQQIDGNSYNSCN